MESFGRIASAAISLMLFVSGPVSALNPETQVLNVVKTSAETISSTYRLKISDIVFESGEEFNSLKKVSDYKEAYDNGALSSALAGKSELKVVELPVSISSQAGFNEASMDFLLDRELTFVGYKSNENGATTTLNNCSVISDGTHVNIKGNNNTCVTENGTLSTLLVALPDNYTADKSYEVGINEETIQVSASGIPAEESVYKIESGNITVRSAYILEIQKTVKYFDSLKNASEYSNIYTDIDMSKIKTEYEEYKNNKVIEVPVNMLVNAGINTGSIKIKCDNELTFIGCKTDENGKIITLDTILECGVNTKKLLINNDMGTECTNTGKLATLLFILPDNVKFDYKYSISFKKDGFNFVANQTLVSGIDGYAMVKSSKPEEPTTSATDNTQNDKNPDYVLQIEKTIKNYNSLKNVTEYANAYNNQLPGNDIKPEYEEYKNNKVIEVPLNMLLNSGINTGTIKLECDEELIFIGCLADQNGKITTLDTTLECGVNTKKLLINNDMGTMCTKTGRLATLLFILPEDAEMNHEYSINFKKDGFNFVAAKNKVNGIDGYAMVTLSDIPSTSEPEITTAESAVTTPELTTQSTVKTSTQTDTDADFCLEIEKTEKIYNSLKSVSQYKNAYVDSYITGGNMKEQYIPYQDNKVIEVPLNMLVNAGVSTGIISFDCDPELKFMGCLTNQDGAIITIDTAITCGINAQKILFNSDQGKNCVKTGTLATLLFILPENIKTGYKYNISFSENGFDFVVENKKIQGINGYAMVIDESNITTSEIKETQITEGTQETQETQITSETNATQITQETQITSEAQATTENTEEGNNADFVLEIEKTIKNYSSLKYASQYTNIYNGDISEGNIKTEYEQYINSKVIEVPLNMLVNSGISTGIISFDCNPELKFMGCLTGQDGAIITLDTSITCGINAKKILFNSDQGINCVKTGTLATLLFILPENVKADYEYSISFSEKGFDFVTENKKIQGINGYAMVTGDINVTTSETNETQGTQSETTENTEDSRKADFVLEIEKTVEDYDSLKCASQYTNIYNGEISEEYIKPEYEEYKNNKVIEVTVNMLVNAGVNTGTIKLEFNDELIFIGCLTDEKGKIITLDTTLECGVNTKKLLINNEGGTNCIKTGTLATLLFILPDNVKMNYMYNIGFKENGFNFVTENSKISGINGYAMLTSDKPVTTEPETPENPETETSDNDKNADFVLEIEKTEKKYNSLKKASEYSNLYNGEISDKYIKPEYEEYKNNKVIEVPVNMLVNAGINTGTIKFEFSNELIFIGCLTDKNGKIVTLDTALGCGVNTQKLLINNYGGEKCVKTGTLAVLLFILPEDVKMDYKYSLNFKENGFNFVDANNKVKGINGYAMVTDGFEETAVTSQTTVEPSTGTSHTNINSDYVLEIEKTIKNYNSLKRVSEYRNVYQGANIEEGNIKLEYEAYKNNRVIEVPMNILVNSGITAGIISFNCAPELMFIGCLTNEDGSVITLDTSVSCGINAQKILFNSDKGDKCVKTGTLATLLFILPENVEMDYEYTVKFEENGFDFVADKKTILGIDGYAMVKLNNNLSDIAEVTEDVTGSEPDITQTSINIDTDKTGTEANTTTEETGTNVSTVTEKTGTKVSTSAGTNVSTGINETGTKVSISTEKTGTNVSNVTDETGTKVSISTEKTGTNVSNITDETGTKVSISTEKNETNISTGTDKTETRVSTNTEKIETKVSTVTDQTGSGTVTEVTTTPVTDVTTIPSDTAVTVNTTKLNNNNENDDKPNDNNNPPVIIICDNIIILQGTKIIMISVKLQNFNIKSYFQETVIDFNFNGYFSISDIELSYQIKTANTRYEIIGNQVHLYNIETTRLSPDAELFTVEIDTQNDIPVGQYNVGLNASAIRAVDYINEDGVPKAIYSEIPTVKGGESTIQVDEPASLVKEIIPGSVKITNPNKKFYYSHLNDKIDMSGLKVTADIITKYDNGQQSTEYGVDITSKISVSDKAIPSMLYNNEAFRYSIDLIFTDAEIAPVGKKIGSFNVLIGELGDITLDHKVDVVDSTILLRDAAKNIIGMSILDSVLNESKSQLEYGVYEYFGEETMIDFMKFLGDIYVDQTIDVIDSTLVLRFSALSSVADVKGKPLDRLSTWAKLLSF